MTITQDLEFSVLAAPLAAVDRRGLSEAWYSALYAQAKPVPVMSCAKNSVTAAQARNGAHLQLPSNGIPTEKPAPSAATAASRSASATPAGCVERRAPRSPLARRIERAFLHPKSPVRSAAFALEGETGRVQIILRARGSNLKLVAICPRKASTQVAAALEQARYALARRGIALNAEMRDSAAC